MSYRPQVKADSNGTTQDLPIDAETVQGKTPVFTTTNQTVEGVKTYTETQKFIGGITLYSESGASPRLTFQRGTLIDTAKDWSLYGGSDGSLYIQQIQTGSGSTSWETRAKFTTTGVDFVGTIKENGTSLADKYATKEEVNSGSGNTTKLYKHELYVSVRSTGYGIVNGEFYFDLYTPQSTPYTTQELIENALKNYGGAIVGGTLGSYQIVKIEYTSDNDGIGVYTWQDESDYQITFSNIQDIVTKIL